MAYSDDQRPRRDSGREGDAPRRESRPKRDGDRSDRDEARPSRGEWRSERPARSEGRPARDGGRPVRDGDRPGRGSDRPVRPAGRAERSTDDAPRHKEWANTRREVEVERKLSPLIPDEITEKDIEIGVRAQLKTLTPENAEKVARHLAMVALLIDQDPDLAHEHALAAADRAGRIAVVRETVGCTAYAVGDFALALRELLTHRRISGSNEQVALIVDSERGLGRPERAIEVGRSVDAKELTAEARVNLAIAMSGARLDLGQTELALSELEIAELNPKKVFAYSPPLFFAYADVLEDLGREAESTTWADLGNRATTALAGEDEEDETVTVLEEIEIPVRREWTPEEREARARQREERAGGGRGGFGERRPFGEGRPSRDGYDRPRRDGDRDARPRRDGDSRPRRDGDARPARDVDNRPQRGERRPYGDRSDRPQGGERRSFGDRDGRGQRGERPERGERRSFGDRDSRPPRSDDRPSRDGNGRPARDSNSNDRPPRGEGRGARPARPVSRDDYRPKRDK
ncbi:MAG: hypothetical protein RL118_1215 [Actinomycetota bacterium]